MDAVNARVTEAAAVVDTSRGPRVVTNFDTEFGNEAKIWCDPDDDEGRFAKSLAEGEEVMLMKGKNKNGTYYTFRDSDVDNHDPSQAQPQQQASQGVRQDKSKDQIAKEHADLIAACYKYLDERFYQLEAADELSSDRIPTSEQIQKMAVSAAMEATS